MSKINYDQSGSDSHEVGELFPSNDLSKLKPQLFKPLTSPSDEIKKMQLAIFVEFKLRAAQGLEM